MIRSNSNKLTKLTNCVSVTDAMRTQGRKKEEILNLPSPRHLFTLHVFFFLSLEQTAQHSMSQTRAGNDEFALLLCAISGDAGSFCDFI